MCVVAQQASATVQAWAWKSIDPSCSQNMTAMVAAYPQFKVEDVARQLNALPDGKRVLLLMRYTDRLATHPSDACRNVDARGKTKLTAFAGPWCTAGEAEVKVSMQKFFDDLKKTGVKNIDALVIDNETNFWAGRYITAAGENVTAIEKDPRFPVIAKRLGFSKLNKLAWGSKEYFRWNEVVQADFDAALNRAVAVPFQKYWPKGITMNYGSTPVLSQYMTPDMSGLGIVYGGPGFGTHNSFSFYGNSLHWIRGAVFAGTTLNDTPFDMFRLNVHRIRSANASSRRMMMPWIANYTLGLHDEANEPGSDLAGYSSPLANTKYWDENVIQLVMHGCDTLMLFNPQAWRADQNAAKWNLLSDQRKLADTIDVVNAKLGAKPGASRWFSLPGLQDRVMTTGRLVRGGTMWRFSFAPDVSSVVLALQNGNTLEIQPEQGSAGAWYFESDSDPIAIKQDNSDVAMVEAPLGSEWPDLDGSGEFDEGDIALLSLEMGEHNAEADLDKDGIVTIADVTHFRAIRKNWWDTAQLARNSGSGSVIVASTK